MIKSKSLVIIICAIITSTIACAGVVNKFDEFRPIAIKGLELSKSNDIDERTKAMSMSLEFIIRAQDWLDVDNVEDVQLMRNVVATAITLKHELQNAEINDLLINISLFSTISSLNVENHTFGKTPSLYPEISSTAHLSREDILTLLKDAISAMAQSKMKQCERILLELYDVTWRRECENDLRYRVANKLAIFYIKSGVFDHAKEVLRQNKIEMDRNGILDANYLECLFYLGISFFYTDMSTIGKCYMEVADEINSRLGYDTNEVTRDYNLVMSDNSGMTSDVIKDFISSNDNLFWFLTERERKERWEAISNSWKDIKNDLLKGYKTSSDSNIDAILNAFQYEKYLMLRSYAKIAEIIRESNAPDAYSMLRGMNELKMQMIHSFGKEWENLNAEYQKSQKALMHHPVLTQLNGRLYNNISTFDVASMLAEDEMFVDFGVLCDDGVDKYFAVIINADTPEGKLIELCSKESLHLFLNSSDSSKTKEMVRLRYEDSEATLYTLIWRPIIDSNLMRQNVYYSPIEEINIIMPEAISFNNRYLAEDYRFHILSSFESLKNSRENKIPCNLNMAAFYGIDYIGNRQDLIKDARMYGADRPLSKDIFDDDKYGFNSAFSKINSIYPLVSEADYDWLIDLTRKYDVSLYHFSGVSASEYAFKDLSSNPVDIIHICTHAFCLPKEVDAREYPYIMRQMLNLENCERISGSLLPMFRTGLLFSGAERHWCGRNQIDGIEDGILNAEELSALDLHNVKLISLIACSTGAGEIDEIEGVIGLRRALKMAGCKSMITTAWNVDKEAALAYVEALYDNILRGESITDSHSNSVKKLMERFTSPYYWAPFQLID